MQRPTVEPPLQRCFDDLGVPLSETTFCVLDLETTGGSPHDDEICEIGAVKVRGGVVEGTFQTLVDPGRDIPVSITVLTGLTTAMVQPAPAIGAVLPSLLEFIGDAVIVGHNVRFDRSFLDAALLRAGRSRLTNSFVDTCALARRLVRDEVPDCKLGTLASRLRLDHRPTHRALDDVLATVDLLHVLLERAAGFGVLALDDLLALPRAAAHPQASKLRLTDDLPRARGVYLFRDRGGRVLYVGKAANLRSRVRSYFSSDTRRKVGGLLREAAMIDHVETPTSLEAEVLEMRLIHEHLPRYNRQGKNWGKAAYVKLTEERFPRLSVVRSERDDGATYLGPVASTRVARTVVDAIHTALPVRRCTEDPLKSGREAPCAPAQLGVAHCPCAGTIDEAGYRAVADEVRAALTTEPDLVLDPLRVRMAHCAGDERYEEAADVRDRATAFLEAHRRVRRLRQLHEAGAFVARWGRWRVHIDGGRLVSVEAVDEQGTLEAATAAGDSGAVTAEQVDELLVLTRWLHDHAHRLVLESCAGSLRSPLPRLPDTLGVRASEA